MKDKLITPKELSNFLSVSPKTIVDWCYRKKLRFLKVGRLVRFRQSDIDAFLEPQEPQRASVKQPERKRSRLRRNDHSAMIEAIKKEVLGGTRA